MNEQDVLWYMRRRIKEEHGTMSAYADKASVTVAYISAILTGRKAIPDWMLVEFGIVRHVSYVVQST